MDSGTNLQASISQDDGGLGGEGGLELEMARADCEAAETEAQRLRLQITQMAEAVEASAVQDADIVTLRQQNEDLGAEVSKMGDLQEIVDEAEAKLRHQLAASEELQAEIARLQSAFPAGLSPTAQVAPLEIDMSVSTPPANPSPASSDRATDLSALQRAVREKVRSK